jgi:transposase-like protein
VLDIIAQIIVRAATAISPCCGSAGRWIGRSGGNGTSSDEYRCGRCGRSFTRTAR